jgi:hypothetical protein
MGNGSSLLIVDSGDAPGIVAEEGSDFELRNASVSGFATLLTIHEPGALIEGNSMSTTGNGASCIRLTASADIVNNSFWEGASEGSYAILAGGGVSSLIHGNTFSGFRHGDSDTSGQAILSRGPLEIFDNLFTKMAMDTVEDPYVIHFIGAEPTLHDEQPVWETNRFQGSTPTPLDERVNIFRQEWNIRAEVISSLMCPNTSSQRQTTGMMGTAPRGARGSTRTTSLPRSAQRATPSPISRCNLTSISSSSSTCSIWMSP